MRRTPAAADGTLACDDCGRDDARIGAKLASYRVLAAALARVRYPTGSCTIVGDGPARAEVEAAFAGSAPIAFISPVP